MSAAEDREAGFTLVETLVAFTILSAAIIVSFQIFAAGLRQQAAVEDRKSLMAVARHELDLLALEPVLKAGTARGKSGEMNWEITITAISANPAQDWILLRPFHIAFRTMDGEGAALGEPLLDTVLLARSEAP